MGLDRTKRIRGLIGATIADRDGFDHERVGSGADAIRGYFSALEALNFEGTPPERMTVYYPNAVVLVVMKGDYVAVAAIRRDSPDLKGAPKSLLEDFEAFLKQQG